MTKWISKTLLSAAAVFFISWLLPGVTIEESYLYAIIVALAISVLNTFVKPILVILTLPATILSLGLFMWVINAGIILLADLWLDGFKVDNFWWALLFSALLSIINSFLNKIFFKDENANKSFFVGNRRINVENEGTTTTVTGQKIKVEDGKKTIIIEKD